jgi:tRNA(adenine34) deaminase
MFTDEYFMKVALREAEKARDMNEVPVGALVVWNEQIIGRGHNQVELLNDCTAHAEMLALTAAFNYLGSKYLPEATVYVTLEPCPMCAGAMYWAKIKRLVYGAADVKHGFSTISEKNNMLHPKTELISGILQQDCSSIMKFFFTAKRL